MGKHRNVMEITLERVKSLEERQKRLEARDKKERELIVRIFELVKRMQGGKIIWN